MTYFWFIGAVIFVLLVSAAPFLPWQRWKKHKPASASLSLALGPKPASPPIVREVYFDSDGFSLLGDNWKWIGNQAADYWCPTCGERVQTVFREYYHAPTGDTFSMMRHKCINSLETRPMVAVAKEGR